MVMPRDTCLKRAILRALYFLPMKYFYQKPEHSARIYGKVVALKHPVYQAGTLYEDHGLGLIVVQQKFDETRRECRWTAIDADIANDIYLSSRFPAFFAENATYGDYPIFQLRKLMWALRIKPLPREYWEDFF